MGVQAIRLVILIGVGYTIVSALISIAVALILSVLLAPLVPRGWVWGASLLVCMLLFGWYGEDVIRSIAARYSHRM